jgi:hypothetical protein
MGDASLQRTEPGQISEDLVNGVVEVARLVETDFRVSYPNSVGSSALAVPVALVQAALFTLFFWVK